MAILNLNEPNLPEIIKAFIITKYSLENVGFGAIAIKNV
jgi:hypothetical protein